MRPEVDQALQSIQASLAALHERLNRVESARSSGGLYGGLGGFGQRGGRRGALRVVYVALSNAVHDIAVLLHLRDPSSSSRRNSPHALAPSYLAQSGGSGANGKGNYGSGAGGAGSGDGGGILGAPVRLALAILNLVVRLALDVTSLAVLVSLLLAIVYRLTGRGDPLIVLRLARRWGRFRSTRAVAGPPAAVGTS